ncbi:uncharacterized mitochondrial protein AtMg00810-like [Alnus glutinosa]|uniref:uncharacterized mitochondrial protein AtMg00810-like n=1 Tax=Alnus glutinosa TaxID=3517 RepID=UPI002D76D62D|nr:uncharacterized mitochondrial protein AtMg00810-like [Alnus glutinosa]
MFDELNALTKTHTWDLVELPSGKSAVRLAVVRYWQLFQMDVKNAFLNADLAEEVYMHPPPGYDHPPHTGFVPSVYDSTLFLHTNSAGIILILLYVDDMIITEDDRSSSDGYYLSQAKYASDLLSKAGLTDSKTCISPLEHNTRLLATLYRQLVGSLIYLTVTRPDISYTVHLVSQFMSAPRSTHYAVVLRILRYVNGTLFHGLHFSSCSSLELRSYFDADWAGDPTDRRSTTGYCFLLGTSRISWRTKKQTVVVRSSTKAEYRALADITAELLWLRWLLTDMGAH